MNNIFNFLNKNEDKITRDLDFYFNLHPNRAKNTNWYRSRFSVKAGRPPDTEGFYFVIDVNFEVTQEAGNTKETFAAIKLIASSNIIPNYEGDLAYSDFTKNDISYIEERMNFLYNKFGFQDVKKVENAWHRIESHYKRISGTHQYVGEHVAWKMHKETGFSFEVINPLLKNSLILSDYYNNPQNVINFFKSIEGFEGEELAAIIELNFGF